MKFRLRLSPSQLSVALFFESECCGGGDTVLLFFAPKFCLKLLEPCLDVGELTMRISAPPWPHRSWQRMSNRLWIDLPKTHPCWDSDTCIRDTKIGFGKFKFFVKSVESCKSGQLLRSSRTPECFRPRRSSRCLLHLRNRRSNSWFQNPLGFAPRLFPWPYNLSGVWTNWILFYSESLGYGTDVRFSNEYWISDNCSLPENANKVRPKLKQRRVTNKKDYFNFRASKIAEINPDLLNVMSQIYHDDQTLNLNDTTMRNLKDFDKQNLINIFKNAGQSIDDLFMR